MQEVVDLTETDNDCTQGAVQGRRAAPGKRPAAAEVAAQQVAATPPAAVAGQKRSTAEAGGCSSGSASRRRRKEPGAAPSPCKQSGKRGAEKRTDSFGKTVSWRSKPSKQVLERIQRALPGSGHRLFLIHRRQLRAPESSPEGAAEEFHVLGATGNVYTVTVGRHPGCTCPDAQKGHVCKHYLFVQLRVLRLPRDDPLVWQTALLPSEADEVLSGQHSCRGPVAGGGGDAVLAPDAVRQQYERLTGAELESAKAGASQPGGQRPIEPDEDCPICFDELAPTAGAAGEAISWCTACGRSAHSACMQKWVRSKLAAGHEVTCPLCRAPFKDGAGKVSAGGGAAGPAPAGGSPGQFLNLGQYSEAHRGGASLEELYGAESAYWIGRRSRGGW